MPLPPDLEHFHCGWLLRVARASEPHRSEITCRGVPWIERMRFEHVRRTTKVVEKLGVGESVAALPGCRHPGVGGDQMLEAGKIGTELASPVNQPELFFVYVRCLARRRSRGAPIVDAGGQPAEQANGFRPGQHRKQDEYRNYRQPLADSRHPDHC